MIKGRKIVLEETPRNTVFVGSVDMYSGVILVEYEDEIIGSVVINSESSEFEMHIVEYYDASDTLETLISKYPHYNFIFIDN